MQQSTGIGWMLDRAVAIAGSKERSELLKGRKHYWQNKGNFNKNRLTLSTRFCSGFKDTKDIVYRYLPILFEHQICADLLKDGVNIISRRAPTLGNSLSPSLFQTGKIWSPTWLHCKGNYHCGGTGYPCCRHFIGGNVIRSHSTDREQKIQLFFNCNTKYVIHIITCKIYHVQ